MQKQPFCKITRMVLSLFFILFTASVVYAGELKIESVYPNLGELGKDLENVTIKGKGFDENTRVSMYLDSGNKKAIIGSVYTPGSAFGVTVTGDMAYVADFDGGLQVIDISDPQNPVIIGAVDTPGSALRIMVIGDVAYVTDYDEGLQVINISNPKNPFIIGTVDTPGYAWGVTVTGDKAYIADGDSGLQVVDISNPQNPIIIGTVDTPGSAHDVTVKGDKAYVADTIGGLQIVDISNPKNSVIIASVDTPDNALGITVIGDVAYVAASSSGLGVIDVSNPQNPVIMSHVETNSAFEVTVIGDTAYVADSFGGLQIIDISDIQYPIIIGYIDTPGLPSGVTVIGDKAYVADTIGGLQIVDISKPKNPVIIGSADTPNKSYDITVTGDKSYVADYDRGLQVIDISNPKNPFIIGTVDTPGYARDVTVNGDKAYVADYDSGLQVIDISNPKNPVIIGSTDTPGKAYDVTVNGDKAYIADSRSGLQVIDISNPQNPVIIGSANTPGEARGVTVIGNKAYVADSWDGLRVIDISNPRNPLIIGYVDTPGFAYGVTVIGDNAYIADCNFGLVIVPLPIEIKPVTVNSETSIALTLPYQQLAGNYAIRVFNDTGDYYGLVASVSFVDSETYEKLRQQKAIILAGGDFHESNPLWQSTEKCATYAHNTLLSQGYTSENIYFLSPEPFYTYVGSDYLNIVDDNATIANLSFAISTWAAHASELLLFITGHGGTGTFKISDTEILTAPELDNWLDTLQQTMPGKVVFVYDACKSGSFLPFMTPPLGKERIVIASSQPDEPSWFLDDGKLSFSWQFWASIFYDARLYDSFLAGKTAMENDQTCLIDADGNGAGNEKEDYNRAADVIIGRGRIAASEPPEIGVVSEPQTLNGETFATLWASDISALNLITRVWGIITPPDFDTGSPDIPVTDLPFVELYDDDNDGFYEGIYNGFTHQGTYRISIYATDTEDLYSFPEITTVTQISGADQPQPGDWITVSGTVRYDGMPLCAMVLANGQYMFTCDASLGKYSLNVPVDENGKITVFAFCDGLDPFKAELESWQGYNFEMNMKTASTGSRSMIIKNSEITAASTPGWMRITGTVSDETGNPLCAMILANGQHKFTCAGDGRYDLEVPLDENGKITLFGFCEGMLPFKTVLKP